MPLANTFVAVLSLDAVTVNNRLRVFCPLPHDVEHWSQALQGPHKQYDSSPHLCVLQGCVWAVSLTLHGFPACFDIVAIWRYRLCSPPPHSTEQSLHLLQSPNAQSIGVVQGFTLQGLIFRSAPPQGFPPTASTSMIRSRSCDPPPHGAVQLPHSVQSPKAQSTGLT